MIAKAKMVQVKQSGISYLAQLQHADIERDLCQLKVPDLKAPALALSSSMNTLKIGQRVFVIGFQKDLGLFMSEGLIAAIKLDDNNLPPIHFTSQVTTLPGGSGLFDEQGMLIGITSPPPPGKASMVFIMRCLLRGYSN